MNLLSRAEEIVLLAVYKLKNNAYGVTIRDQIFSDINKYWSFGVIYKTLKKLAEKDYVGKNAGDPVSERGGRTKFYYRITDDGLKALAEIQGVHASLWDQPGRAGRGALLSRSDARPRRIHPLWQPGLYRRHTHGQSLGHL